VTDGGSAPVRKSLGTITRKAVDLTQFSPVRESVLGDGQKLPLKIEPAVDHVDLAEWARNNRAAIEQKLYEHGGILFRGFGLSSPADFEKVAGSICRELYAEYGDLPREGVAGKVYTSTPYPPDKSILYHNESSHMHAWPSKINFFCVTVASEGGATPIVDCREVYRRLLRPSVRFLVRCQTHPHPFGVRGLSLGWATLGAVVFCVVRFQIRTLPY